MINYLKTLPQYFIPQKALSKLLGHLANQKFGHQQIIKWFIKNYNVDMSEAKHSDIKYYKSFNDFFIRQLKDGARPIEPSKHIMISPVDGKVSQLGKIHAGRIIQAKGRDYSVSELLGNKNAYSSSFNEGSFATLYLSPKDYHRVHMPINGTLKEMTYIPGDLFAVKPSTADTVPNLFSRNERLVMFFETDNGPLALVMVGAMIVGNIATIWQGTLPRSNKIKHWQYPNDSVKNVTFNKGDELGHFKLGSTVVLLTGKKFSHHWHTDLSPNSPIKLGQRIN